MPIPHQKRTIPLKKAVIAIAISVIFTLAGVAILFLNYSLRENKLSDDSRYQIIAILQCCEEGDPLTTQCLAEQLNLSVDQPVNLYSYDLEKAKELLLANPVIKEASLSKCYPETLQIDYRVRTPIAYLGNIHNSAIDEEGVLFPVTPFLTPKNLPQLYLEEPLTIKKWGDKLPVKQIKQQLKSLEQQLDKDHLQITRLDLSRQSKAPREFIAIASRGKEQWILRLSHDYLEGGLKNFRLLRRHLLQDRGENEGRYAVDLRLPKLAYFQGEI